MIIFNRIINAFITIILLHYMPVFIIFHEVLFTITITCYPSMTTNKIFLTLGISHSCVPQSTH